ncbi:hypothetical protein IC575_024326 [Cucumis melo]
MFFMQTHPVAKGLLNKSFSYYDELAYVFGRDRVMGHFVETFIDVGSNDPSWYEGFQTTNGNDKEFPSMYSQGFDMSQDDVRASHPACTSECRTGSNGSKQRREGQWVGEIEMIHEALECENDQLRMIAEWPSRTLQNETTIFQEVLR